MKAHYVLIMNRGEGNRKANLNIIRTRPFLFSNFIFSKENATWPLEK